MQASPKKFLITMPWLVLTEKCIAYQNQVLHSKTIFPPTDGSSARAYQWCRHLENASKAASATASLLVIQLH